MEARVAELEVELKSAQCAGLKAEAEADKAEQALDEMRSELDEMRSELGAARQLLASREGEAREAAQAAELAATSAAAEVRAAKATAASTIAALTRDLEGTRAHCADLTGELAATKEAMCSLEAVAAAAAAGEGDVRAELARAARATATAEEALRRREAALALSEDTVAHSTARAAMLAGEAAYFAEELDSANTRSAELQAAMQAAMQAARAEAQAAVGRAQHTEAQSCAARSQLAVARAGAAGAGAGSVIALLETASMLSVAGISGDKRSGSISAAKQLFSEGCLANDGGDVARARRCFEAAFLLQPRVSFLLSIGNMSLKLDDPAAAVEVYRQVLAAAAAAEAQPTEAQPNEAQLPFAFAVAPTEKEIAMAARKEGDATRRLLQLHMPTPDTASLPHSSASSVAETAQHDGACSDDNDGTSVASSRMARHAEQLSAELRQAKAAAARALADRAALAQELRELQQLHRRAQVRSLADREKLTSLEVKMRTSRSEESHGARLSDVS